MLSKSFRDEVYFLLLLPCGIGTFTLQIICFNGTHHWFLWSSLSQYKNKPFHFINWTQTSWFSWEHSWISYVQAIFFPETKLSCSVNFAMFLYSIKVKIESIETCLISKALREIGLKEWWEGVPRLFSLLVRAYRLSDLSSRKCFLFHQWKQAEMMYY